MVNLPRIFATKHYRMAATPCYVFGCLLFTDAAINGGKLWLADRLLNCRGSNRQMTHNGCGYAQLGNAKYELIKIHE